MVLTMNYLQLSQPAAMCWKCCIVISATRPLHVITPEHALFWFWSGLVHVIVSRWYAC